ncbi:MAG: VOC family protein, partial [Leptolyngbyaceae bacterium]|nr:VOC family protein [Leptolyngbyaceae bacterium]
MKIDHVHFYVEDAPKTRDWFVQQLGFHFIASGTHGDTRTEVVKSGSACFVLSSPLGAASPVAEFLRSHPSGVFDLAFRVEDLPTVTLQAVRQGAKLLKPTQVALSDSGCLQWSQITGWGGLKHSLIERSGITALLPAIQLFHADGNIAYLGLEESEVSDPAPADPKAEHRPLGITGIDHVVLNVATGDLERAVHWYQQSLGFHLQQSFKIQTERSALRSQVMVYPGTTLQFPINEPASANSQIQEFLDINRGPGIQHIALQTSNLVQIIAQLRQRGIDFLSVPPSYYQQL